MRRVVITGIGVISPHGIGAPAFWNALLEGKSSITPFTRFDPSAFSSRVAGVVPPFKCQDFVPRSYRKSTKIMAHDIQMAVVAADFAARDGKLATKGVTEGTPEADLQGWFKPDPTRLGCNIGSGLICVDMDEIALAMGEVRTADNTMDLARWGRSEDPTQQSGMEKLTPLWMLKYLPNMLACHVTIIHDAQGPSNAITCGQASAGLSIMEAARTIQRGQSDMALAGGCESKVHAMGLMRWSLLNRLSGAGNDNPPNACRPYDKAAAGVVLSEGGAVFLIEEYEHAKKRGATIYAELAGFGASANAAASPIDPDPTGEAPAVAIKKALKDAGITADQVQAIFPPSYAVPEWDRADVQVMRQAFGTSMEKIAVIPVRGGIGDCGAGCQALDLAAAAMSLHQQTLPPAPSTPNPIGNLNIPQQKTATALSNTLVYSAALGGQNSAVILKRVT